MLIRIGFWLLLSLGLTACLNSHPTGANLEGKWKLLHVEIDGVVYPDYKIATVELEVEDGGFEVYQEGEVTLSLGKYRYEEMFYPKHLDVWVAGNDDAGLKRNGIFRLKGDTLEACFAAPKAYRPAYFETRAGDKHVLTIWKRIGTDNEK
ncbi:MAG: TIGR03067 domain-containing protein [Sphingobacteriaceae bacterium]|nr:TIGR03067 domain-containing protein [Sphingobacteriaceae bacterium]